MSVQVDVGRHSTRTPVWGTAADKAGALRAQIGAVAAVGVYVAVAHRWFPDMAPTALEIFGTATSLSCVWLTRRQNVLSIPLGLLSVLAMGAFFFDIGLVGQGWLHLGFYVPISFLGWRLWLRAGDGGGEMAVRWMPAAGRAAVVVALLAIWVGLANAFHMLHGDSPYLWWDASIVAASVGAQILLSWKRAESYLLWLLPVNVSAVALYVVTGAYLFAALYLLYIVIAASGLVEWARSAQRSAMGADAVAARVGK